MNVLFPARKSYSSNRTLALTMPSNEPETTHVSGLALSWMNCSFQLLHATEQFHQVPDLDAFERMHRILDLLGQRSAVRRKPSCP